MPELTEVITAVTGFIGNYAVYISAGLIVGLGANALHRLVRAGR